MSFETEATSGILKLLVDLGVIVLAIAGGIRIVTAIVAALLKELRRDLHEIHRNARGIRQELRRLAGLRGGV